VKNELIGKEAKSLLLLLVTILSIGLVVLYSASFIVVYRYPNVDPNYYMVKQFAVIVLGMIVMTILASVDYRIHRRYIHHYYVLILFLLSSVLILPSTRGGARRWFDFKYFTFQPSEFTKLFIIIFLAHYIDRWKERIREFFRGFLVPLILILILAFLVFLEPDLSTAVFIVLLSMILLYVGGTRWYYILSTMALGVLLIFVGYKYGLLKEYQIERLREFLDLITGKGDLSWQTVNSLSAIRSGGLIGVGLGLGNLKYYLPIQISDFIFAVLGEEMGMLGMGFILLLYVLMVRQMLRCAFRSVRDGFGRLLIIGYAFWILLQVAMNVSVVVGLIPITGLTLPFLSQGGSSIMAFLSGYGIVLSVLTHK